MILYNPAAPTAGERRSKDANFRPGGKEPRGQPFGRGSYHDHPILGSQVRIHRCEAVAAPTDRAVTLLEALCEGLDAVRDSAVIVADRGYPKQDGGTDFAR